MNFQICGLDEGLFSHLFGQEPDVLAKYGVKRIAVDSNPGSPCRVSLRDVEVGETVLLMNYEHQPANSPYRSSHAIFVKEWANNASVGENEVPEVLRCRLLSVRAFDEAGMMLDADVVDGHQLEMVIDKLFLNDAASYLHVHNAKRGCFAALVERV